MSDNSFPAPGGDQNHLPPALPSAPTPAPFQAYPGAAPSFPAPPTPSYSPQSPIGYGSPSLHAPQVPSGYAVQAPYGASVGPAPYGAVVPMQQTPGYASYAPAYAAPRPTSGLAITSFICSMVSFVFGVFLVPALIAIVAVVTGHMALKQTKENPSVGGRGLAFAGLIIGYAVLGFGLLMLLMLLLPLFFFGAFSMPFFFAG